MECAAGHQAPHSGVGTVKVRGSAGTFQTRPARGNFSRLEADTMAKVRLGARRGMHEVVIPVDAALARDATRLLGEILQFLFQHELLNPRHEIVTSNPSRSKRRLIV